MNVLVTAGNTLTPIDLIRGITNVFSGRTGARIALHAHDRGHSVTLLTSHPEVVPELRGGLVPTERWAVLTYRTFDDLQRMMKEIIGGLLPDVVIHSAAVSDYRSAGIYSPAPTTRFLQNGTWESEAGAPTLLDRMADKVKSDEPELWLRLIRTPKLIDLVRSQWKFRGVLVKFKLEVGIEFEQLLEVAERSRLQSKADLMVANTLESLSMWADLGPIQGSYQRVTRADLPDRLLDAIESLHGKSTHG